MSTGLITLATQVAKGLDLNIQPQELITTLKSTAFKVKDGTPVTDEQMMALLVVSKQYHLNPWTKEIYAFPDKGGITPIVGVDGWSRIINEHPQFDGMEFRFSDEMVMMPGAKSEAHVWCEAVIYRKDRTHPVVVREYLDEVYRAPFKGKYGDVVGPWQTHPKRFHRHKTLIQGSRIAFGFAGIYDEDEAERIRENQPQTVVTEPKPAEPTFYSEAEFNEKLEAWGQIIAGGKRTVNDLINIIESKGKNLTDDQRNKLDEFQVIEAEYTEESA